MFFQIFPRVLLEFGTNKNIKSIKVQTEVALATNLLLTLQ